ncbi:MAG: hypothetical protein OHK0052_07310 [Anaerolineales bacterium]
MTTPTNPSTYIEVRRILWAVLIANLLVTALKITLGLMIGALSVVADGFHSLVDSSSNIIGLAALRLANRPADARHPYGYQRYETLGALMIGGLLLAAAWEIFQSILARFQGESIIPEITPLTLGLVAITFPVNLLIVWLETRAGKRLKSELLLADAAHTRTDLFVTGSVVLSLVGVWLGLGWLDWVIAAGVVVLIVRAAVEILRDAAGWLTDANVLDTAGIEAIAQSVPGVWYVHRIRSRGNPAAVFVDLHVKVYPGMSTEQAHGIASAVELAIKRQISNVIEVIVHIEPARVPPISGQDDWQQMAYEIRKIADGMGLGVHDLHISLNPNERYSIEMDLEMHADISLGEAHARAEEFEARLRWQYPQAERIITHLEPLPTLITRTTQNDDPALAQAVRTTLLQTFSPEDILEVQAQPIHEQHRNVSLRLRLPKDLSLRDAHLRSEQVSASLRAAHPTLKRLRVHVEPSA